MSNSLNELNRKQIRYWCFRFYTESTGGDKAVGAPVGLKEHFESLDWFSDWKSFGIKWDVRPENPLDMVPLKQSLESQWNMEITKSTRMLS